MPQLVAPSLVADIVLKSNKILYISAEYYYVMNKLCDILLYYKLKTVALCIGE